MAEEALRVFLDGSCEPINPGGTAGFGVAIFESGKLIWQASGALDPRAGPTSNNVAEYAALIAALEYLLTESWQNRQIKIRGETLNWSSSSVVASGRLSLASMPLMHILFRSYSSNSRTWLLSGSHEPKTMSLTSSLWLSSLGAVSPGGCDD